MLKAITEDFTYQTTSSIHLTAILLLRAALNFTLRFVLTVPQCRISNKVRVSVYKKHRVSELVFASVEIRIQCYSSLID